MYIVTKQNKKDLSRDKRQTEDDANEKKESGPREIMEKRREKKWRGLL